VWMHQSFLVKEGGPPALELLQTAGDGGASLLLLFPVLPVLLNLRHLLSQLLHLLLASLAHLQAFFI
jgi:hypothetical protein